MIDIIRYGNFCYIAFDVASVINHCFVIQVTTPGTMRANPDPGVVGVEAWFWVEGILGGDPSYTQLPGGHPRITGSGNRYTVNLAATGTGLWSGPDPGEPGAITADGVWLDTTESYGSYDCDTQGLGMMINWQHWPRATGVELFEAEHLYPVASLEEGGRWRQVAWDAIRAQLQGPDPGATPTARMRAVDGEIGVVPARTRFAGRLELEEYQWTFEPGDVGDGWTYDAGGAGLQPTQAHFANPSTYSGEVRYTYDYHGLFNARVSVIRRLVGDLTYRYYETYHYEDVFARTWYPQVHRSWGTTSCRRVTFPSTGPPQRRLAPAPGVPQRGGPVSHLGSRLRHSDSGARPSSGPAAAAAAGQLHGRHPRVRKRLPALVPGVGDRWLHLRLLRRREPRGVPVRSQRGLGVRVAAVRAPGDLPRG